MTLLEYMDYLLNEKQEGDKLDEKAAYKAAALVTGSFVYKLYRTLWLNDLDAPAVTAHLETMYDHKEYRGFLYFIILLAKATELDLPAEFYKMSVRQSIIPILSAAVIDDWLDAASNDES